MMNKDSLIELVKECNKENKYLFLQETLTQSLKNYKSVIFDFTSKNRLLKLRLTFYCSNPKNDELNIEIILKTNPHNEDYSKKIQANLSKNMEIYETICYQQFGSDFREFLQIGQWESDFSKCHIKYSDVIQWQATDNYPDAKIVFEMIKDTLFNLDPFFRAYGYNVMEFPIIIDKESGVISFKPFNNTISSVDKIKSLIGAF